MKIWKFSPGRNGRYWEYCRDKRVAAIGWSRFGDLSNFKSLKELSSAFYKDGSGSGMWNTGDTQLWNFYTMCNIGDVIVAYGNGYILGKGKIKSPYFFANEPIDPILDRWYSHRKKIQWEKNTQKETKICSHFSNFL